MRYLKKLLVPFKRVFVRMGVIGGRSFLKSRENLLVGKGNRYYTKQFFVRGIGKVYIGNYCSIGQNVRFLTSNHNYNFPAIENHIYEKYLNEKPRKNVSDSPIRVGSDVWIGDNVIILNGVRIGNGSIIGAGSIVTKNVEDFGIVAGCPAKHIGYRYSREMRDFLLKLKWWNWSERKIKENKTFFLINLNKTTPEKLKKVIN